VFLLFVVLAIPLAWVGYQLNWIRQRHALLYSPRVLQTSDNWSFVPPPAPLHWFGEFGKRSISFYTDREGRPSDINAQVRQADLESEMRAAELLFPEAEVRTTQIWRTR